MKGCFVCLLFVIFAISGCSGTSNLALGKFDYVNKTEGEPLVIPDNLSKPKHSKKFVIQPLAEEGFFGKDIDVRSPSLVLPIATASRLEQNSSEAFVWFDQVIDQKELYPFILSSLKEMLEERNIALTTIDDKSKHFQSSWFIEEDEDDYWIYSEIVAIESTKFDFHFEVKPHGRSVGVKVIASGYMKTDKEGASTQIGLIDKQRSEMQVLNNIIEKVDFKYRNFQQNERLEKSNQQLVHLGVNTENEPAYIVQMELDSLWSLMPEFFEEHSFRVSDLNQPTKTYYVNFEKPSNSIWSFLGWADKVPVLELENGAYQFKLRENSTDITQTDVTIYDANGQALSKVVLEQIFPVIEPGLSFKSLFN